MIGSMYRPPNSNDDVFTEAILKIKHNILFFANSFAATTGTNTRKATFKNIHSALL